MSLDVIRVENTNERNSNDIIMTIMLILREN
jgi:hypothetical protein